MKQPYIFAIRCHFTKYYKYCEFLIYLRFWPKILKPNSSWLTFGISKFVSLSISHFYFFFFNCFTLCCHIPTLCYHLAITSQNYYHFGYYISNSPLLAITSQNYYLRLYHSKFITFGYSISKFIYFNYCIKTQHRYQPSCQTL